MEPTFFMLQSVPYAIPSCVCCYHEWRGESVNYGKWAIHCPECYTHLPQGEHTEDRVGAGYFQMSVKGSRECDCSLRALLSSFSGGCRRRRERSQAKQELDVSCTTSVFS